MLQHFAMRCVIISSRQSAVISNIVKHC